MTRYDIVIIGGGPGGYTAAIRASMRGARVALVEQGRLGGVCLNCGCIPVKALYRTARHLRNLPRLQEHGIHVESSFVSAEAFERKAAIVARLTKNVASLLKSHGVTLVRGRARLMGAGLVAVTQENGEDLHLEAQAVVVATGTRPFLPKVWADCAETSDEFLTARTDCPRRLLVVGGGYIGCEMAAIMAAFRLDEVLLVEKAPELLRGFDRQAVKVMERELSAAGVRIFKETTLVALEKGTHGMRVQLSSGETCETDAVLAAMGRYPNVENLGLETAGVKLAEDEAIAVDSRMRTTAENVYAIGDVTNIMQLATVAIYQGEVAVDNILGIDREADYRVIPSTVFTFPEMARVGLQEDECRAANRDYVLGSFPYVGCGKAQCDGETLGAAKLLFAGNDGALLGGMAYGEEASLLIAEVAVAMRSNMKGMELADTVHAHPTLSEIVRETAADAMGLCVHKASIRKSKRDG